MVFEARNGARVLKRNTTISIFVILVLCLILWLSALNSFCDQGGDFFIGVCFVTQWMPW
ncbi:PhoP/PhoQ regulator MgrB [Acerihabitans sp. TG2]|uniref:PhoP/PhoQ regulator MgrB n=1 Tax=Acerihabitans sp. TG2 TaxID=3096008 RepID=UPI002B22D838|nr:PhoP/PhoQ regulator MgrB [Acerihabitans sp. TG2]MEA9389514.1 PhoP/PhoQ regulator MgrB [Acerihabitans sp. TG2]